jgi:hypothetical protein
MGYRTDYTLEIVHPTTKVKLPEPFFSTGIAELKGSCEEAGYSLDDDGTPSGGDTRWYEHEKDIREFSKRYPSFLFILSGEGEESGDIWKKYFLNGKCQVAKAEVRCADFDPKKLK